MMEEKLAKDVATALDIELKNNGPFKTGEPVKDKLPTLTAEIDRVIAACHHRIKLLEAIRSTL